MTALMRFIFVLGLLFVGVSYYGIRGQLFNPRELDFLPKEQAKVARAFIRNIGIFGIVLMLVAIALLATQD